PFMLQLGYHLADAVIDERDFIHHFGSGGSGRVFVSTLDSAFDELLADAHSLKVHAEDVRYRSLGVAQVSLAVDLIQNGIDFHTVVTWGSLEIVGPGSVSGGCGARPPISSGYSRKTNHVGVDVRGIVIVYVAGDRRSSRAGDRSVDRMFVGP